MIEVNPKFSEYPTKPPFVHIAMKREDVNRVWQAIESAKVGAVYFTQHMPTGLREAACEEIERNLGELQKYFPNPGV